LDHHVEHALAQVDDHISNMIGKIEKREDKSEGRIGEIETVRYSFLNRAHSWQIIKREIDGSLEQRLNRLENQLNGNMNRKVKGMETELNKQIEATLEVTKTSAGSWKIPFLIIIVLLGLSAIGLFFFYKHLLKKHIL
jgi:hypothetical protein